MNQTNQLTPIKLKIPSLLIQPVADNDQIVEAWNRYSELKTKLLSSSDYQIINNKQYIKKSGWRKLQTAFAISDEITKQERKESGKQFTYEVTVKVSAQNGRFAYGVGSCSSLERNFAHVEHDVRSTAHTRAKNRAISDLIGGGEVTAEEMESSAVGSNSQNPTIVSSYNPEPRSLVREFEINKISERQKNLLSSLIIDGVEDEDEKQNQLDNLPSLSKSDASQLIQEFLNTKKINSY